MVFIWSKMHSRKMAIVLCMWVSVSMSIYLLSACFAIRKTFAVCSFEIYCLNIQAPFQCNGIAMYFIPLSLAYCCSRSFRWCGGHCPLPVARCIELQHKHQPLYIYIIWLSVFIRFQISLCTPPILICLF